MTQLDGRSQNLLKTLIEQYIADGHPVGSRELSRRSELDLSAATVRNVMADLEEMGLITSPHTSAGRIPTSRGYRLFIDTMLTIEPLDTHSISIYRDHFEAIQPQKLLNTASNLLSELTRFAGVVVTPNIQQNRIRQVEFIRLAPQRILLVLVTNTGDVQNRLIVTERPFETHELEYATNYLSAHFVNHDLTSISGAISGELASLKSDITNLMQAAIEAGMDVAREQESNYLLSGEKNLLDSEDLASNMQRLRELFNVFDRKTSLLQLLDLSKRSEGVQIFIGGESGVETLDGVSLVSANYKVDGHTVGSLGVIGPTRMAYERVIPIVDITAKLLSSALTQFNK